MKVSLLILNTVKQIKIKIFKYPFQISSFFPSIHPSLFSPLHRLYQFLPFRDRSGRRILMVLPGEELSKIPPTIKVGRIVCLFFCFGVDCEHRFCPVLFLYYTILLYQVITDKSAELILLSFFFSYQNYYNAQLRSIRSLR